MRSRNILILAISQVLGLSGLSIVLLLGGIIGADLAPSPSWATMPLSVMTIGLALSAIPAALLMKRIGRRRGFVAAAIVAGLASLLAAYAVARGSFVLLCTAFLFIGANLAFIQQYRFAAVESVQPRYAGRAVSLVLTGGIAAGLFGPQLAERTQNWLPAGLYTGSFVAMAILYAIVAATLIFFRDAGPQQAGAGGSERPLRQIAAQPVYLVAVLIGAVASGVMTFIMTATPLELHNMHHYSLAQTGWVIEGHIVAMYLPSLFTGFLLDRLGVLRVAAIGIVTMLACVALGIVSQQLAQFWGALVLLGLGWNLLFVGGTVLLGRSYQPAERFKSQAANDFAIFGVQALASLSAGSVLFHANWITLNLITLPLLLLAAVAVLFLRPRLALARA
jgi:MFS family permease